MIEGALAAGLWGAVAGSALIVGALLGYYLPISARLIAAVMGFGAGVLVSVLSFDLIDEAYREGGFAATATGFLVGAVIYTAVNVYLSRRGARHRKRSGTQMADAGTSGTILAFGALLDGIPESIVIGLSLLGGGAVSAVAVAGIFVSNIPEGLSSATGMRHAGHSARFVIGIWVAITLASGVAALVGYVVGNGLAPEWVAVILATAAGGVLAMLADTMIPEAFETAHDLTGLVTVSGFLVAFVLSKLGG